MKIENLQNDRPLDCGEMKTVVGGFGRSPVGAAFEAGWKIGKLLDSEYGISDAIAGTDDHPIITEDVKNAGNPQ